MEVMDVYYIQTELKDRIRSLERQLEAIRAIDEKYAAVNLALTAENAALHQQVADLSYALDFYAAPATYFAIGFFPDNPAGEFMDDFDKTELGVKPGKLARATLAKY